MKDPVQQRSEVLELLKNAVTLLEQSIDARILPQSGARIAYAIAGARDKNGIAAVTGGVVRTGDGKRASGACAFGADEQISPIILTAMKFDPIMRSAATIRYSAKIIPVLEEMLLLCRSFNRSNEPPGISTMDWGVASCCADGVPDVIFDCGSNNSEPLIRIFGENPVDVTNNIIMLSNRIIHIEI